MNATVVRLLLVLACYLAAVPVRGAEVPSGTVLSKANIDTLLGETFQGKIIRSLLTDHMVWMIRNHGFEMKLAASRPVEVDPRWVEASKRNASAVTFDPKTRTPLGWKGGLPFPNIDPGDPHAGDKVAFNTRYGLLEGHSLGQLYIPVYLIDLGKGIERIQNWVVMRVHMTGRVGATHPTLGDGTQLARTVTALTYPQDIRGIGFFSIRYHDSSRIDDKWVYVNQMRRTKRVSGGGWMDPLGGGTDVIQEDLNVWDAPPNWYPSVRLVGKRWLLAVAHAAQPVDATKKRTPAEMLQMDVQKSPHFNSRNGWEPREVYELEVTPTLEHPYGKRMIYIDAQVFQAYHSEIYDKKGEFWKIVNYERAPITAVDGFKGFSVLQGRFIDFKRRHATVWASNYVMNDPKINENTVSVEALEREAGR